MLGPNGAGEDIVVAVIDTGLWMGGHPSFNEDSYWPAANAAGVHKRQSYAPLKDWQGACEANGDGTPFSCK